MKAAAQTVKRAAEAIRTSGLTLTDALGLAGFAVLVSGVSDYSMAAAKIVAGACLLAFVIVKARRK